MKEVKIQFPGYVERCVGFTIPENGQFYVVSYNSVVYYQMDSEIGKEIEIEKEHVLVHESSILLDGKKIPFIGVWGGSPLHKREGIGELQLSNSIVSLIDENGQINQWKFENFSGDWEQITFDRHRAAFLFGTPYDFDYRYVYLT